MVKRRTSGIKLNSTGALSLVQGAATDSGELSEGTGWSAPVDIQILTNGSSYPKTLYTTNASTSQFGGAGMYILYVSFTCSRWLNSTVAAVVHIHRLLRKRRRLPAARLGLLIPVTRVPVDCNSGMCSCIPQDVSTP